MTSKLMKRDLVLLPYIGEQEMRCNNARSTYGAKASTSLLKDIKHLQKY